MDRQRQQKAELLQRTIKHIDITAHDTRALIAAFREMSLSARDLGRACEIYERMLKDPDCTVILTVAGSTSAAGCMQVYVDLVRHNMVDAWSRPGPPSSTWTSSRRSASTTTGAASSSTTPCCASTTSTASTTPTSTRTSCSSATARSRRSPTRWRPAPTPRANLSARWGAGWPRIRVARRSRTRSCRPPMSTTCRSSARRSPTERGVRPGRPPGGAPDAHVTIDSARDFRELTEIKIAAGDSGLLMIGGGSPKNFAQDTVVCAEILGRPCRCTNTACRSRSPTCATARARAPPSRRRAPGARSTHAEQMVFAEATIALPLLAAYG